MKYPVNVLSCLFTIEQGIVKVFLVKNTTDPYKGYWVLPSKSFADFNNLEKCNESLVLEKIGINNVNCEQCYTFSDITESSNQGIETVFVGVTDITTIKLKQENIDINEANWFSINAIPKLGFNQEEIIKKAIDFLRKRLINSNVLKCLFPSDFTLPEIQRAYEQILNKELDRRNFRKKFINLDLIEDTGYRNEGYNGRPAKLYRFKDNLPERELF